MAVRSQAPISEVKANRFGRRCGSIGRRGQDPDFKSDGSANSPAVSNVRESLEVVAVHDPLEKGIGDVRRVFSGEILFAEELMSFTV
jgi:hypothetical protein